jgi:N-acetylmuramoyl-L-alanine amidase
MILAENKRQAVELAQSISRRASQKANVKVRGIKGAGFMVLKSSHMPAVLVEIGYLSNQDGERKLANSSYRQKMAEGIARGIMDFKAYAEGRSQERCAVGRWD